MNQPERISAATLERPFQQAHVSHAQNYGSHNSLDFRIMELEIENSRLQRLVAELLLKNQQLRRDKE